MINLSKKCRSLFQAVPGLNMIYGKCNCRRRLQTVRNLNNHCGTSRKQLGPVLAPALLMPLIKVNNISQWQRRLLLHYDFIALYFFRYGFMEPWSQGANFFTWFHLKETLEPIWFLSSMSKEPNWSLCFSFPRFHV